MGGLAGVVDGRERNGVDRDGAGADGRSKAGLNGAAHADQDRFTFHDVGHEECARRTDVAGDGLLGVARAGEAGVERNGSGEGRVDEVDLHTIVHTREMAAG